MIDPKKKKESLKTIHITIESNSMRNLLGTIKKESITREFLSSIPTRTDLIGITMYIFHQI